MTKITKRGFNDYLWDGLTEGAILAIYHALCLYNSPLAVDLTLWLENNSPVELEPKEVKL